MSTISIIDIYDDNATNKKKDKLDVKTQAKTDIESNSESIYINGKKM